MGLSILDIYLYTLIILSVALLVSSLEEVKSIAVFQANGMLSWKISKLGVKWLTKSFVAQPLNLLLHDAVFSIMIYVRVALSTLLLVFSLRGVFVDGALVNSMMTSWMILALFLMNLLVGFRNPYGLNGAYQMRMVILLALAVASFSGFDSTISMICLWFITAELLIAYFISGITKFSSPLWRSHLALKSIFGTFCFGHPWLHRFFANREAVTVTTSWMVFCFEVFFCLCLIFPSQYVVFFICGGILFHLFNAIFMGLNDFLYAFCAAYPALYYCSNLIH